jgi:DNA-binding beta-propeller fold protein YncE
MKFVCLVSLVLALVDSIAFASERSLETVAGTGHPENNGDSGPAATINVGLPFGVEIGPDRALYITEIQNHRVLRLDLGTKTISTIAGNGRRGYSGDGGLATGAAMNEPYEIRFGSRGDIYVVEMQNHIVRRIDAKTRVISTVAGSGSPGDTGDGGPATKARLKQPHSIALDRHDNLYIADIGNHRIRRVDAKTQVIESIAGNSERALPKDGQLARGNPILGPRALFVQDDTLWIALREGQSVWRMALADGVLDHVAGTGNRGYAGDGGAAIDATFNGPKGIAVGPKGAVFVVDSDNNAVREIDPTSGRIRTIAGKLNQPHGICVAPNGDVFIGDSLNHRVLRLARVDAP